jgi:hypothetical protein
MPNITTWNQNLLKGLMILASSYKHTLVLVRLLKSCLTRKIVRFYKSKHPLRAESFEKNQKWMKLG